MVSAQKTRRKKNGLIAQLVKNRTVYIFLIISLVWYIIFCYGPMEKHYLAVAEGIVKDESGVIDRPIARSPKDRKKMAVLEGGRSARTEWRLLEPLRGASLLDVHILTGRTHQIRVHLQSIGHPVAGDPLYGLKHGVTAPRLMLHAYTLAFTHPRTGERLRFTAPLPDEYREALQKLRLDPKAALPL